MGHAGLGGFTVEHALLAVFLLRLLDGVGNSFDRFFPADCLELAFTALADALERRLQAILCIYVLDFGDAAYTDALVPLLACIVGLHLDQATIACRTFEAAARQAMELMTDIRYFIFGFGSGLHRRKPIACCSHTACKRAERSDGCRSLHEAATGYTRTRARCS